MAAARLTDPALAAAQLAVHGDAAVREALVGNVTDREVLAKVAKMDAEEHVRRRALKRLGELR